jgi:hypothetical protein
MWGAIRYFASEWMKKPTGLEIAGMVLGFLLFLLGVVLRNRLYRLLGLVVVVCSLIAGVVQYIFG